MRKPERPGPERPGEDELLAYLDGELPAERQAEIRLMLDADWELRADLSRIERRIEKFIEATAHQSPAAIPPVDDFWRDYAGRRSGKSVDAPARVETGISLFAAFSARPNPLAGWARSFGWPRLSAALAAGLVAIAAFGFLLFRSEQKVSAEELLRRAAQAESARAGQVAEPVVYRRLQVRRRIAGREDSATWESWKDARSDRFRQRVAGDRGARLTGSGEKSAPEIVAELERIFHANQLDARRPLSASAYEAWRKTVRKKSESVTEVALAGSQAGLKLTTIAEGSNAADAITEASLVVRRSDWHAVAQQLKARGEGDVREYELSEVAYEVLPLRALTAFADIAPTPSPPLASPTSIPASPSPSIKALPTEATLREAEVAAIYALHQSQADLDGQIEIARDANGQVVARGLVETAERKERLIESLSRIPLVITQIQTIEEAGRRKPAAPSSPATVVAPGGESSIAAPGGNAFGQRLARHFAESEASSRQIQQRIAQLSNAVVSESNAAIADAWALRRLADRFAAERGDEVTAEARLRLDEMKRNHLSRLKTRSRSMRAQLEPALTAIAGEKVAPEHSPPESSPQAQALLVFKAVEQVHQLTHKLFAGTGLASETPEQSARQLLKALARLEGTLSNLER